MSEGLAFVFGAVISAVIWFIVIRHKYRGPKCLKCNTVYSGEDKYCPSDGTRLKIPKIIYE